MGQEGTMSRAVLACAAAFLLLGGSKPDAVWWFLESHDGAIGVTIAAEQSDLCHPDCSTEAVQVSPQTFFVVGHRGDGGLAEGPVGPGVYRAPAPEDGGTGVLQWSVGGVCDDFPPYPLAVSSGTVTLTHVPSNPSERLEGFYNLDPSDAQYGFTSGSFSAHTCP